MANNPIFNDTSFNDDVKSSPSNRKYDLTGILVAQLLHNNANYKKPLDYMNFPSDHPGHLNIEKRIRFVSILRDSILADEYRFGSSISHMYIKKTIRHPKVTPEMIGVILHAESITN